MIKYFNTWWPWRWCRQRTLIMIIVDDDRWWWHDWNCWLWWLMVINVYWWWKRLMMMIDDDINVNYLISKIIYLFSRWIIFLTLSLTLLKFKSSMRQDNFLFPFGINVLACFHSKQPEICCQRVLEVVNLLQNTVRLDTSPISPPCWLSLCLTMEVFPQPGAPISNTGLPASLNRPMRCEIRCIKLE